MIFISNVHHYITFPVDTGRKLNVHKTFRGRPGRLLNVICTFNLRPVSTWICANSILHLFRQMCGIVIHHPYFYVGGFTPRTYFSNYDSIPSRSMSDFMMGKNSFVTWVETILLRLY